jgi:uncharacterized protein (TIGR03083 family)
MHERVSLIRADSERIAELASSGDLAPMVPSCPEWTLRDLVLHIGEVQRFWAANIREGNAADPVEISIEPPQTDHDLAAWMRDSTDELVHTIEQSEADAPCWTWWGDPLTVGAVARHQVQEAAVHRWDAELVGGAPSPLSIEVAADGVGEFLQVMFGSSTSPVVGTITFHATDCARQWQLDDGSGGPTVAVSGTASDLVLVLFKRLPVEAIDVAGDDALFDALLNATDTE